MVDIQKRIPVVGSLAYIERVRRVPPTFTATLTTEADNRYFRHAIAVVASGEKVGYVAPEIASRYYDSIKDVPGAGDMSGAPRVHLRPPHVRRRTAP